MVLTHCSKTCVQFLSIICVAFSNLDNFLHSNYSCIFVCKFFNGNLNIYFICQLLSIAVIPQLFLITYHLWDPWRHRVPPCSRKTQSVKYRSIKCLENQNRDKCLGCHAGARTWAFCLEPELELNIRSRNLVQNLGPEPEIWPLRSRSGSGSLPRY